MGIQTLINGMSAEWQRERAAKQMTLGKMIDLLESMPGEFEIDGFGNPHSYRGYYCDLAFKKKEGTIKASAALDMCKKAMGEVFCGYKGGNYMMGRLTPIWISEYGCCGVKIMGIGINGRFVTEEDD